MSQIMCSQFWPTESAHSNEYGHFVVTFAKATPKPDWKMTVLQVTDKNRVSTAKFCFQQWKMIFTDILTERATFLPRAMDQSMR